MTDPASTGRSSATIDGYAHWLVVDGRFVGTWRREETTAGVEVTVTPHRSLTTTERKAWRLPPIGTAHFSRLP